MSILYGRYFVQEVDSLSEGLLRISQTHSVRSARFDFLAQWWRDAIARGHGFPFFEDGGALIEVRPSMKYMLQLSELRQTSPR